MSKYRLDYFFKFLNNVVVNKNKFERSKGGLCILKIIYMHLNSKYIKSLW